ncbi:MAG: hypothetical protein IPP52_09090 [Ignavibacteria bacterium]|nr:hypothetical protein [Ignavibacteria bacterium]
MDLNKEDQRNRKFILVQMPEKTAEDSEAYKAGYKTIADICKERVRRVIGNLTSGVSNLTPAPPKERGEAFGFSKGEGRSIMDSPKERGEAFRDSPKERGFGGFFLRGGGGFLGDSKEKEGGFFITF